MKEYMPFIKGRNIPSKEGKIIDDRNPATGEVFFVTKTVTSFR